MRRTPIGPSRAPTAVYGRRSARLLLGLVGGWLLIGCGHAHPEPDAALVAELSGAIAADLHAMGQPPLSQRGLRDQALQLAWSAEPARINAIRSGALGQPQLISEAHRVVQRIAGYGGTARAPVVLLWLLQQGSGPAALSTADRELLDCLRAEVALELPHPGAVPPPR